MSLPERGDYVTSTFLVKPIVNLAICIPFNDINMFRTLSQKCIKYRKRTWLWKLNKFLFAIISVIYLCWRLYMWGVCVTNRGGFFGWWISSDIYTGVQPCLLLRNMRAVLYLTGGCNWFQVRHLRAPSAQVSDIDSPFMSSSYHGNFTKLSSFYLSMPLRLIFILSLHWPITNSMFISCIAIDFNFLS